MPLYTFINSETGEEWEHLIGIAACETFLQENPHISRKVSSPRIVSHVGDGLRVDGGFKDVLGRIARANPTSPLAEEYGDKGIKAVKIRETVKKVQKKHGIDRHT